MDTEGVLALGAFLAEDLEGNGKGRGCGRSGLQPMSHRHRGLALSTLRAQMACLPKPPPLRSPPPPRSQRLDDKDPAYSESL